MNQAHWHLVTNHLPIIGTYFSTMILAGGLLFRNSSIIKTGLLMFVLSALLAIPALLTGEGAEDVLESIGQKSKSIIHTHEELAEKVFWLTEIIGIISLIIVIIYNPGRKFVKGITFLILISGLINSVLMTYVGNTGGEIRHTEVRDLVPANSSNVDSDEH